MKRFFTLFFTFLLATSVNLRAQEAESTIPTEQRLFGTWTLNLEGLASGGRAKINPNIEITFKRNDFAVPGTKTSPDCCYFTGSMQLDKYTASFMFTFDWYLENQRLYWKATDSYFYCEALENMDPNNSLRKMLETEFNKGIKSIEESMMMLGLDIYFQNDENLILKPKEFGVLDNGKIKLISYESEGGDYDAFHLKLSRPLVLTGGQYKDGATNITILTCKRNNTPMDFNEEANATIFRWDAANGLVMTGYSDTPEPGTYLYYVDDDGVLSNLHKEVIHHPLQLEVVKHIVADEESKRIITDLVPDDDGYIYCYRDHSLLLNDGRYRISVFDYVQLRVTCNGTDITDQAEFYDGNIKIDPNNYQFTYPGTHTIYAKTDSGKSLPIKFDAVTPVYFEVTTKKVQLGQGVKFLVKQGASYLTTHQYELCYASVSQYLASPFGPAPEVGTYTFYAVVDEKVASNKDQVEVIPPGKLELETDLPYNKDDKYLIHTNDRVNFKVKDEGNNITSQSTFYSEGKTHGSSIRHNKPGVYTHYATSDISVSNCITIEVRGDLTISYDRKKFRETGIVDLSAMQDHTDVTAFTNFYHKSSATNNQWVRMQGNVDNSPAEGHNYYKAIRDDIFESSIVMAVNRKGKYYPSDDIELIASKDTITLGESIEFVVKEGEKVVNAKLYYNDEPITSPYTPTSAGKYDFVAIKSNKNCAIATVVVLPKDQQEPIVHAQPKKKPKGEKWEGTYQVTTSRQLVYNQDGTTNYLNKKDTLNITIAFDQNLGLYRLYGLCKNHPELDILTHITEEGDMVLMGSSFKYSAKWVFIMQEAVDGKEKYRYYTSPSFALPYVFTINESGEITHKSSILTQDGKQIKVVATAVFNVDERTSQIRHLDNSETNSYPAGVLKFKRISDTVTIPEDSENSYGKSSHTTTERQDFSNFLSIFAPRN